MNVQSKLAVPNAAKSKIKPAFQKAVKAEGAAASAKAQRQNISASLALKRYL
jgi:hypothetical protein